MLHSKWALAVPAVLEANKYATMVKLTFVIPIFRSITITTAIPIVTVSFVATAAKVLSAWFV